MYPLQGPPGQAQPVPPEYPGYYYQSQGTFLYWLAILACFIFVLYRHVLSSESVQLHLLHGFTRSCQTLASYFGMWALAAEHEYNEIVTTLH